MFRYADFKMSNFSSYLVGFFHKMMKVQENRSKDLVKKKTLMKKDLILRCMLHIIDLLRLSLLS